jgi:hypothetical protein
MVTTEVDSAFTGLTATKEINVRANTTDKIINNKFFLDFTIFFPPPLIPFASPFVLTEVVGSACHYYVLHNNRHTKQWLLVVLFHLFSPFISIGFCFRL